MSQNRFDTSMLLSAGKLTANRKCKSSGSKNNCGSFPPRRINLFRHRPDARVALQQSPILQSDMDKLREMNYNGKRKSSVATATEDRLKSLRPFTQLLEHTPGVLFQ